MRILALDIGSSSVKAAVLGDPAGEPPGGPEVVRTAYPTRFEGVRVEIEPASVLTAIATTVAALGAAARDVDLIALAVLSPGWVAMAADGTPLTPIVTHADRRSVDAAAELERRVGADEYLALAGNRPFPGGIASSTWAWFVAEAPELMRRANLVGQLNTYLHRQLTGARVTDPSNASFLGVYRTATLDGWAPELVAAVGGRLDQLPEIRPADAVAGTLTAAAAAAVGLRAGTPMLTGCVDGSSAMLAAGAGAGGLRAGQLVNVVGSSDVLAMCVDAPVIHRDLLTRALGVGRRWVSVATLASVGSTLDWAHRTYFADLAAPAYWELVHRVAAEPDPGGVTFAPYLAGSRTSMRGKTGGFAGLTLASTRERLLSAVVEALIQASAARLPLMTAGTEPLSTVYLTGGPNGSLAALMQRDWPPPPHGRSWRFVPLDGETLVGLGELTARI